MSDLKDWGRDLADNTDAPPDGFPEKMQRSDVNDSAREMMAAVKRYYDEPSWRIPWDSVSPVSRVTGTQFLILDTLDFTWSDFLIVNQMVRASQGANVWIGHVTTTGPAGSYSQIDVEWQADRSTDTTGPTANPDAFECWLESGNIVFRNTGTASGEVPTIDDLDPHVTTPENSLDVGLLEGLTAIEVAQLHTPNLVTNGSFNVWQREISFPSPNVDDVVADCWFVLSDESGAPGTSVVVVDRVTDVPGGVSVLGVQAPLLRFSARLTVQNYAGTSRKSGLSTLIELRDGFPYSAAGASETVSASVWCKGSSGISYARLYLYNCKTDTPSVTPVSNYSSGSADLDVTFDPTEWELVASVRLALTTDWERFALEDVDMDASSSGSGIFGMAVIMDDDTFGDGDRLWIAGAQITATAQVTPFQYTNFTEEVLRCKRSYTNSYDFQSLVFPGDVTLGTGLVATSTSAGVAGVRWDFPVPMRAVPTVNLYSQDGTVSDGEWTEFPYVSGYAASSAAVTTHHVTLGTTTGPVSRILYIHAEAVANIWGNT
jgi:hypothetical protein